ncbi:MAG: 4Fe-4S dicluster domain-containing protein [Dissulfurispiraceae bacterium]|jgi:formate dehydrogenase iron-sulfur subunit|nr:4Fe-4S dicluster domain-containing protein [Dissulfurispiraceae bacterium]
MANRKALLISPELCTGCRACQVACKSWNQLPAEKTSFSGNFSSPSDLTGNTYNTISFLEAPSEDKPLRWLFVSQRCMHCEDAGCMKICPVPGAIYRTEEGAVVTDSEKCIGCKLCSAACPFDIPRFDKAGKLSKCTMCSDRLQNNMEPACAKTCPTGAISFGNSNDLIAKAKKAGYTKVYGEKDLDGLGALYAFKDAPTLYGYKENPKVPEMVVFWHKYLKPLSLVSIGGVAAASLLHYALIGPKKDEEGDNE